MTSTCGARVYSNGGNRPLLRFLRPDARRILDVGCGAGDNAALMKSDDPSRYIEGVTVSAAEAQAAKESIDRCWVFDVEGDIPAELQDERFDAIVFSHVLEHLRSPAVVLERFARLLMPGGQALIAVPNVLSWRTRLQFALGRFEYEEAGVLDETHLRFFTYVTADRYLLGASDALRMVEKAADGSVPLWWARRYLLPAEWARRIDEAGTSLLPNLFGGQILLSAVRR